MSSTGKKVAELAGVSIATVSRVLSGHSSVRPETKYKVMNAIEACGYVPNEAARAIAHLGARARRSKSECRGV